MMVSAALSRSGLIAAMLAAASLIAAPSAKAADVPAPLPSDGTASTDSGWQIYWPTYLWAAGATGSARTLPPLPKADIDISFGDSVEAMKDLDAGLITSLFVNNGRFRMMGDVNWMRLSPEDKFKVGDTTAKLSTFSETLSFMGLVGYRLVDDPRLAFDVYAGAKYWYTNNSAKLKPASLISPNHVDEQQNWVDAVIGTEILSNLTDQVYVTVIAFAGTGGSKYYGDIYGGFGYRFNAKYDAFAGYRAMTVDREQGDFSYNVTQHGPLLGFGVKF